LPVESNVVGDFTLRYRSCVLVEALGINEATIRRTHQDDKQWWMLWFYVICTKSPPCEQHIGVPIQPNRGPNAQGPGGRTWGFTKTAAGVWTVSPSINVLAVAVDFGPPQGGSWWHQVPSVVDVPDGEPWQV
jgi:hypothetical protein